MRRESFKEEESESSEDFRNCDLILFNDLYWPVIRFEQLWHVGTMDQDMKGRTHNATSLEGSGLSVSCDPDAWIRIAKLGGNPVWELRVDGLGQPGCFVDTHSLDDAHLEVVQDWAQHTGLLEPCTLIVVSWYDSETDGTVEMVFDSSIEQERNRAQEELRSIGDEDATLTHRISWRASEKLNERTGFKIDLGNALDMALAAYIEDNDRQGIFSGLWWEETLDVANFSAPRGVILKDRVDAWSATQENPTFHPLCVSESRERPSGHEGQ